MDLRCGVVLRVCVDVGSLVSGSAVKVPNLGPLNPEGKP